MYTLIRIYATLVGLYITEVCSVTRPELISYLMYIIYISQRLITAHLVVQIRPALAGLQLEIDDTTYTQ